MVWDIELGMTRAEVIKMLGEPDEFGVYPVPNSETWQRIVFSVSIYRRITAVYFDSEGKANLIYVDHDLFDHRFAHSRGSILPAWIQRD